MHPDRRECPGANALSILWNLPDALPPGERGF